MSNANEKRKRLEEEKIQMRAKILDLLNKHFIENSSNPGQHSRSSGQTSGDSGKAPRGSSQGFRSPDHSSRPGYKKFTRKGSLVCSECGQTFTQTSDTEKHMNSMHGKAPYFPCRECSLSFRNSRDLNRHILTIHRRQRSFVCLQCNAGFSIYTELAHHVRVEHAAPRKKHANNRLEQVNNSERDQDKPYFSCVNCTATFRKKIQLIRHETLQHGFNRPPK